jgi:hypothetical protein
MIIQNSGRSFSRELKNIGSLICKTNAILLFVCAWQITICIVDLKYVCIMFLLKRWLVLRIAVGKETKIYVTSVFI